MVAVSEKKVNKWNAILGLGGSMLGKAGGIIGGTLGLGAAGLVVEQSTDEGKGGVVSRGFHNISKKFIEATSLEQGRNGTIDQYFGGQSQLFGYAGFFKALFKMIGFKAGEDWIQKNFEGQIDGLDKQAKAFKDKGGVYNNILEPEQKAALETGLTATVAGASVAGGLYTANKLFGSTPPKIDPSNPHGSNFGNAMSGTNPASATSHAGPSVAVTEKGGLSKLFSKLSGGKAGIATTVVLGGAAFMSDVLGGKATAEAATDTVKTYVPYVDAADKGMKGDTEGAAKSATVTTVGLASFAAGMAPGATLGGAWGSVAGPGGTVVGGIVGGVAGGLVSSGIATTVADYAWDGAKSLSSYFTSTAPTGTEPAYLKDPAPAAPRPAPVYAPKALEFDMSGAM